MTKMAAMLIYGKNPLKVFFFETSYPVTFELGTQHQELEPYKCFSDDDPGQWPTLQLDQIGCLMYLYGKMLKY